MGKNKKKSKQTDEFFEKMVKTEKGAWSTAPVSDMMVDGDNDAPEAQEAVVKASADHAEDMQVDKAGKVNLGVTKTSMKRGQKSRAQQKRKVGKLEKAMARVDKVKVRVQGSQSNKVRKLSLKHMY